MNKLYFLVKTKKKHINYISIYNFYVKYYILQFRFQEFSLLN